MPERLLLLLVIQAAGMGLLHLACSRERRLPLVLFTFASGALATIAGMALLGGLLIAEARLSLPAAAWIPAFALGFFTTGAVLGAAWILAAIGIEIGLKRAARRVRRR